MRSNLLGKRNKGIKVRINCHCHIFNLDCVPTGFQERFLLDVKNPVHRFLKHLVKAVLPEDSRVKEFLGFVDLSISEIADKLVQEMDEAGINIAVPLMMDMAFCKGFAGGTRKTFEEQLVETANAVQGVNEKHQRLRLLPFVAADPRRENLPELVREALEGGLFRGVKIYPAMGFLPADKRLYPVYEYCTSHRIPITTHCQNGGIPGLGDYYHLADPANWRDVLKDFPDLILNLAHNDRTGSSWQPEIARLIMAYPNVYTDISYDMEMFVMPRRYFKSIKEMLRTSKIRERVLYGTDWYMGRALWTECSYLKWFLEYSEKIPWCRVRFTEEEMGRLMEENPKRFLGL